MSRFQFCPQCRKELLPKVMGGRERRVCPDPGCGFVYWDNPTPVVAAIIERDQRVILVRNKGWPEKLLGLAAGFLERDEAPADGVRREVKEELGLDTGEATLVGVYPFAQMHQVILAYHVVAHGEVTLGEELEAYKAIPIPELKPWPFGTGLALRDWLAERRG